MEKAIDIVVHGKVQGVAFRKHTQAEALRLGLKGYVKNQSDGTVFIHAVGEQNLLLALYEWCKTGSPLSDVTDIDSHEAPLSNETTFEIQF